MSSTDALMPSQAITSSTSNRRRRGRNNNREQQSSTAAAQTNVNPSTSPVDSNNNNPTNNQQKKTGPRKKNRRGKKNNSNEQEIVADAGDTAGENQNDPGKSQPKKKGGKKQPTKSQSQNDKNNNFKKSKKKWNKNNNRKHAWWRKQLPEDAVDPITLDPLESLNYPPFALVGKEPYIPIEWPPPKTQLDEKEKRIETEEERKKRILEEEQRRLEEQWGAQLVKRTTSSESLTDKGEAVIDLYKHINLFDGRALAYYMVSQLQFIDPLNRRDLTRDELVYLDRYLRKYGFTDLNVTEAYDAKGVQLSSAGAAAQTAAGQAAMLQQEAQTLLNALFGRHNPTVASSTTGTQINNLRQQYESHENSQQQHQQYNASNTNRHNNNIEEEDVGVYGDEAGLVIIDDDLNPGLRGNAASFVPNASLYSASHIRDNYGSHTQQVHENDFPSLETTVPSVSAAPAEVSDNDEQKKKKPLPKAKTLSKIGNLVKKTDPEEMQRQWEAREAARRKAALSNLTFGSNQVAWGGPSDPPHPDGIPAQITTKDSAAGPTEAQLERNRAFAEALGVKPATVRQQNIRSGWSRPSEGNAEFDEFGNELNSTVYPDSLVIKARELRSGLLDKLEKKWKIFLADDTSASLPLNPMDKAMRTFAHEYSDYWKLHTESFDSEPRRYIHCVKMRDTSAPYPLLSQFIRTWRPGQLIQTIDHSSQQTAGQKSGRDLPEPPSRTPLALKPRTVPSQGTVVDLSSTATSIGGAPSRSMVESEIQGNSRFGSLSEGRERPKIYLQKRTLPLELPPYEPQGTKGFDASEELERLKARNEEKSRREREEQERKQRAIEEAFASDEEKEVAAVDDSDSDWEVPEQAYNDNDED